MTERVSIRWWNKILIQERETGEYQATSPTTNILSLVHYNTCYFYLFSHNIIVDDKRKHENGVKVSGWKKLNLHHCLIDILLSANLTMQPICLCTHIHLMYSFSVTFFIHIFWWIEEFRNQQIEFSESCVSSYWCMLMQWSLDFFSFSSH